MIKKERSFERPKIMRRENVSALFFEKVTKEACGPGTWFTDDGQTVIVCPECSKKNIIVFSPEAFIIDTRGLIWPSIICENEACLFDRYVLLKGWTTMGRFSRRREREEGVILYCLAWRKWTSGVMGLGWYLQPFEYCHATSQAEAKLTWDAFLSMQHGEIVAIAPSYDPHVAGDADPRESVLGER